MHFKYIISLDLSIFLSFIRIRIRGMWRREETISRHVSNSNLIDTIFKNTLAIPCIRCNFL
jgi:hypothetical protein